MAEAEAVRVSRTGGGLSVARRPSTSLKVPTSNKPEFTRALVRRLITKAKVLPVIRALVARLWRDIDPRDKAAQVEAVANFIKAKVQYFPDARGVEQVSDALDVLERGFGDCDDLSVLTGSLLEAGGYKTRLMLVSQGRFPSHIFIEALVGGDWVPVDTSRAAEDVFKDKKYNYENAEGGGNMAGFYDTNKGFYSPYVGLGWYGGCGAEDLEPGLHPGSAAPLFPRARSSVRGFGSSPGAGQNVLAGRSRIPAGGPDWMYIHSTQPNRVKKNFSMNAGLQPRGHRSAISASNSRASVPAASSPFAIGAMQATYPGMSTGWFKNFKTAIIGAPTWGRVDYGESDDYNGLGCGDLGQSWMTTPLGGGATAAVSGAASGAALGPSGAAAGAAGGLLTSLLSPGGSAAAQADAKQSAAYFQQRKAVYSQIIQLANQQKALISALNNPAITASAGNIDAAIAVYQKIVNQSSSKAPAASEQKELKGAQSLLAQYQGSVSSLSAQVSAKGVSPSAVLASVGLPATVSSGVVVPGSAVVSSLGVPAAGTPSWLLPAGLGLLALKLLAII